MRKSDFHSQINAWLQKTGDQICGEGEGIMQVHGMYVDDIAPRRFAALDNDSNVKFAVAVLVDEHDNGGEYVEPAKKRRGVFVVADSAFILARDSTWFRNKYEAYGLSGFMGEPITFKPRGQEEEVLGVRLRHLGESVSYAFGLRSIGPPNPDGMQAVRDRILELVNGAVTA